MRLPSSHEKGSADTCGTALRHIVSLHLSATQKEPLAAAPFVIHRGLERVCIAQHDGSRIAVVRDPVPLRRNIPSIQKIVNGKGYRIGRRNLITDVQGDIQHVFDVMRALRRIAKIERGVPRPVMIGGTRRQLKAREGLRPNAVFLVARVGAFMGIWYNMNT